jgi:hypothetical protein
VALTARRLNSDELIFGKLCEKQAAATDWKLETIPAFKTKDVQATQITHLKGFISYLTGNILRPRQIVGALEGYKGFISYLAGNILHPRQMVGALEGYKCSLL